MVMLIPMLNETNIDVIRLIYLIMDNIHVLQEFMMNFTTYLYIEVLLRFEVLHMN